MLKPGGLHPNAGPYERLAALWEAFADWSVPGYGRFLPAAGEHYRTGVSSVLDLACGAEGRAAIDGSIFQGKLGGLSHVSGACRACT